MRASLLYLMLIVAQTVYGQHAIDTRVGTAPSTTLTAGMFGKGSEEKGQTLPAVLVPNGMNFWTPQTQDTEVKCRAPYYYTDTRIQGFRASHWIVGGCTQDYGSFTLMPITIPSKKTAKELAELNSQIHCNTHALNCRQLCPEERSSQFTHEQETATPSYYKVWLQDYKIQAEMTGLSHSAIFRFTYPTDSTAYLVINPNSDEGDGFIEILPHKHQIRGYNPAHRIYQGKGQACGFSGWFIVQLPEDTEFANYGTYHCDTIFPGRTQEHGKSVIGAFVQVQSKELLVKVATSFVDWEGCGRNLQGEIPHWSFEHTQSQCASIWEKHLECIQVRNEQNYSNNSRIEDITQPAEKTLFTALYHASFLPREFSDVDGRYPSFAGGEKIMQMPQGHRYYDDFSMWDTYRALHPLLCLTDTAKTADMMQSLVFKYKQGGWMPIFPCWNSYTTAMIGDHCTSAIADAYVKGVRGFDILEAYKGLRQNAFVSPSTQQDYKDGKGRRALASYLQYGYIPLEDSVVDAYHKREQVSRTLEYAYDDFCLAQIAQLLSKEKFTNIRDYSFDFANDYKELMRRAKNYRHVINPSTGFAQGRYVDGTFCKKNQPYSFQPFITEGAPCHYTFYVPHDVKGLIHVMGGKSIFTAQLDSLFERNRYWHGNEPCHQIAYLYNYIGQPWKTQQRVHHIMRTEYNNTPGGLSGNDDAGQMSAWYIFSAIGFYPVCPGTTEYAIGTPMFPFISLRLANGKKFTIVTHQLSERDIYIQTMRFNGKRLSKPFLQHHDIMQGGTLELEMGSTPCKK